MQRELPFYVSIHKNKKGGKYVVHDFNGQFDSSRKC